MGVVAEVMFGQRFGCLVEGADVGCLTKTLDKFLSYASCAGQVPYLHKFLLWNPLLPVVFLQIERINNVLNVHIRTLNQP